MKYQKLTEEELNAINKMKDIKSKKPFMDDILKNTSGGVSDITGEVLPDDKELLKILDRAQKKERINKYIRNKRIKEGLKDK